MRRLQLLMAPLAVAATLAGCAGEPVIDAFKTEAAVLAEVQVKTGTKIASVKCPTDVEVIAGAEFSCFVTARDGAEATADLRILNEDADVDFLRLTNP